MPAFPLHFALVFVRGARKFPTFLPLKVRSTWIYAFSIILHTFGLELDQKVYHGIQGHPQNWHCKMQTTISVSPSFARLRRTATPRAAQALLVLRRDFYRAMGQARARVGGWVEEVSSWDVLESIEMTAQVQRCPTLVGCLEEAGHHRTSPNID